MTGKRATGWVLGTAVLVVVILAATWFFVATPRFESAAEITAQAEDTENRNDILEAQVAKLAADFEKLDEYKTELAAIRKQVPTEAQLTDYARTLAAAAEGSGVFLSEVTPGVATIVTIPAPPAPPVPAEPPAGEETEGEEAEEGADDETQTPPPAPTGPAQIEGFVAIPLSFKVLGPYADTLAFLERIQTGEERLFLVTGLNTVRQEAQEASGGKPAVVAGDLEATVEGYLYVLRDTTTPVAVPDDTGVEETPLPSGTRNPFEHLPGTASSSS